VTRTRHRVITQREGNTSEAEEATGDPTAISDPLMKAERLFVGTTGRRIFAACKMKVTESKQRLPPPDGILQVLAKRQALRVEALALLISPLDERRVAKAVQGSQRATWIPDLAKQCQAVGVERSRAFQAAAPCLEVARGSQSAGSRPHFRLRLGEREESRQARPPLGTAGANDPEVAESGAQAERRLGATALQRGVERSAEVRLFYIQAFEQLHLAGSAQPGLALFREAEEILSVPAPEEYVVATLFQTRACVLENHFQHSVSAEGSFLIVEHERFVH
jgi:hypothetical protein